MQMVLIDVDRISTRDTVRLAVDFLAKSRPGVVNCRLRKKVKAMNLRGETY
jgi:hypothetical protein